MSFGFDRFSWPLRKLQGRHEYSRWFVNKLHGQKLPADLLQAVETLNRRGVVFESVKESLASTGDDSAISKLILTIMGGMA